MYPIMQRCRVALWDTVSDVVSSGCILGIFARLVHHPGNCHILQKNIFRVLHTTYYFYVTISIRAVCSMPFQKRPVFLSLLIRRLSAGVGWTGGSIKSLPRQQTWLLPPPSIGFPLSSHGLIFTLPFWLLTFILTCTTLLIVMFII